MSTRSIPPTVLSGLDADVVETLVSRRRAITQGASASGIAMAAFRLGSVPVALAALSREAFGQGRLPTAVIGVLNFALKLEYLESEFYNLGVASSVIPSGDSKIFTTIQGHETTHVAYIKGLLGASARPKPTFDYTGGKGRGGGPFGDVFTNYATFLAVSQAFEDTGVRAFKGQAATLQPYKDVLQAALTIHSVEARHAAEVRRLRGGFQDNEPFEGWISNATVDVPAIAATYAGEDNVVQLGIDVTTITTVPRKEITEAFDEPLTMADVLAIVDPFFV